MFYAYKVDGMYERPEFEAKSREDAEKIAFALGYVLSDLNITTHKHHGYMPRWQRKRP